MHFISFIHAPPRPAEAAAAEAGAAEGSEQQGSGRMRRKTPAASQLQLSDQQSPPSPPPLQDGAPPSYAAEDGAVEDGAGRGSAVGEKAAGKGTARGGKGGGRGRGRGGKAGGLGGGRGAAEEPAAEAESDVEEAAAEKIAELAEKIAENDTLRIKFTVGDSFAPGTVVVVTPGEVLADAQNEEFQVGK